MGHFDAAACVWRASTVPALGVKRVPSVDGPMRRQFEKFLPVVLLALVVQILAPVAALRLAANSAAMPICTQMAASTDEQGTPQPVAAHGGCCPFCVAGLGATPLLTPPPQIFVALQRAYQHVAWLEATMALPVAEHDATAQARAPPLHS